MKKQYLIIWLILLGMIVSVVGISVAQEGDADGDGIPDSQDLCPYDYGHTTAFSLGCPDRDGDRWHDWDDACPDTYGTSWEMPSRGCPDSDNDGFADMSEQCPSEYGTSSGCPDNDGDGVNNPNDPCPNEYGTSNGCPDNDSDRDGFANNNDNCPNEAGTIGGCPDSDGDGVINSNDACLYDYGTVNGCPDSDGDGIANNQDACPNQSGTENGCPPSNNNQSNNNQSQTTITENSVNPADIACELTAVADTETLIYVLPTDDEESVGTLTPEVAYPVYGIKTPEIWYQIAEGWVKGEGVNVAGNCGGLVGFNLSTEEKTIPFADIDLTTAQISCVYLPELSNPFCFYKLPVPNDDTATMICIIQSNIINCEMGNGLLFAILNRVFGGDVAELPQFVDLTGGTGNGGVNNIGDNTDYPDCANQEMAFFAPYFESNQMLTFRILGNYLVGFLPKENATPIEADTTFCKNMTRYITPIIANNEIQPDFAIHSVMTQYESWLPNGWNNLDGYEGDVPIVALLLPDVQKSLAKKGILAGAPIRIDFLNQLIVFGDGSVFFGFNTIVFDELVQNLTEIDFSPSE